MKNGDTKPGNNFLNIKRLIMKKKITFTTILLAVICSVNAQNLRINGYANYVFDDSFDSYYDYNANTGYEGKIAGGFQWGVGLEYMIKPTYGLELYYMHQDTKAPTTYFKTTAPIGWRNADFDLSLNYIMLGGARYVLNNPKVNPYFGLSAGACIIDAKDPENGKTANATKFAWGFRGGVLLNASEKIGLKLTASLLSAVQGAGAGLYIGTGGAGAGVSTYSSMYQFALGGSLVISLGGAKKQ